MEVSLVLEAARPAVLSSRAMLPSLATSVLQRVGLYGPLVDLWRMIELRTPAAHARQHAIQRLYRQFISPGTLCFDVGANLGERTAAMRDVGARVVAVEPHPGCARRLRDQFRGDARVLVIEAALGPSAGVGELTISQSSKISTMSDGWRDAVSKSGRFAGQRWDRRAIVRLTTLDDLIAEHGTPVFVKIDVEGFEAEVLAGLHQPVPQLCFEVTPERIDAAFICIDRLMALGDYQFNYDRAESQSLVLPAWMDDRSFRLVLQDLDDYADVYARATPVSGTP
jgi:FkbM family methyltransferase